MNNKEFSEELARRLGGTVKDVTDRMAIVLSEMTQQLQEEQVVSIANFGSFEVNKKAERILINATTNQRLLVPPKLIVTYTPSEALKDKFN